mmetsp:Transcript_39978/g.125093  ORF Transcript_39978/g.125093 Transcript_39978/m.125093 type:complete len:255 (-) Transcript_39978:759-1523(-)
MRGFAGTCGAGDQRDATTCGSLLLALSPQLSPSLASAASPRISCAFVVGDCGGGGASRDSCVSIAGGCAGGGTRGATSSGVFGPGERSLIGGGVGGKPIDPASPCPSSSGKERSPADSSGGIPSAGSSPAWSPPGASFPSASSTLTTAAATATKASGEAAAPASAALGPTAAAAAMPATCSSDAPAPAFSGVAGLLYTRRFPVGCFTSASWRDPSPSAVPSFILASCSMKVFSPSPKTTASCASSPRSAARLSG